MNKALQEEKKRNILNMIRHTSRSGNQMNAFKAYMSETEDHIRKKFEVWLKLRKNGYDVLCEPIFNSGIRMDLLAFREGLAINYEVLESETIKELSSKTKNYPEEITIIAIKSQEDIDDLELI